VEAVQDGLSTILLPLAIARLEIQRMEEAAARRLVLVMAKRLLCLLKRMVQRAPSVAAALLSSTRESVTMFRVDAREGFSVETCTTGSTTRPLLKLLLHRIRRTFSKLQNHPWQTPRS
jgi:hypothetical protein